MLSGMLSPAPSSRAAALGTARTRLGTASWATSPPPVLSAAPQWRSRVFRHAPPRRLLAADALPSGRDAPAVAAPGTAASQQQWLTVVGLAGVAAAICAIDRAAISVAILPMAQQYDWSESVQGAVSSTFFLAYGVSNFLAGIALSQGPGAGVAPKRLLGGGVLVWSAFTALTPAAAASASIPLLLAVRGLMGAGEGVAFPTVQVLVRGFVPPQARTRALAGIYSGAQVGTVISLLLSPLIISTWGWPAVFECFGALGLLWLLAWQPLVPEDCPLLAPTATAAKPAQQQQPADPSLPSPAAVPAAPSSSSSSNGGGSGGIPWGRFLRNRPFLAILAAHGTWGIGHYVTLAWLPTYFSSQFGTDVSQSAGLAVLPWVVTIGTQNAGGWAADLLVARRITTLTTARKLLQIAGSLGPAGCLLALAYFSRAAAASSGLDGGGGGGGGGLSEFTAAGAAVALTLTVSLAGFQAAGYGSNHQDLSRRYAAALFGASNALSSLLGSLSVYGAGVLLERSGGDWGLVFGLVAGCYALGAAVYGQWASAEEQFDEGGGELAGSLQPAAAATAAAAAPEPAAAATTKKLR